MAMKHVIKRNGHYYFNRRVPELVKEFDRRAYIRIALNTDSPKIAAQRAVALNKTLQSYWDELMQSGESHNDKAFKQAIRVSKQLGFNYLPAHIIAQQPLKDIRDRTIVSEKGTAIQIEAVLGGVAAPDITVNAALDRFWDYTKDRILGKTEHQVRKWKNPRKKAVENFIESVGNKSLSALTRDDIIKFRDWWAKRIDDKKKPKNASSANKDLIYFKNIIETVSDNLQLKLEIDHLFKKIMFKERFEQKRLPFTREQILAILQNDALNNLNQEARDTIFALAGTGARPSEIVGLLPEDIKLNADIPHISIVDRPDRPLKTPHSQRDIPLMGFALDAFIANPSGFPRYRDNPDNLTGCLSKFLRENKLLPSNKHSVYSFRHSFQDGLLSVDAPDRLQAELMGHQFERPKYGDGATLQQKQKYMRKFCVDVTRK